MKKLTKEQKEKIKTGLSFLLESSTTLDRVQKMAGLLKGMNPSIDKQLKAIEDAAKKIHQIQGGKVIELSLEKIPEDDKTTKNRKKYLLALLANWETLQSEVKRIQELQEIAATAGVASKETVTGTGKILATMKGPLGIVTIAAAGIVAVGAYLSSKSVDVTVKNIGCRPFEPVVAQKINLPGLKLPSASINSGDTGSMTLPGVDMTVDTTKAGTVKITTMGVTKEFGMPSDIREVTFDGKSIMGKVTTINLSKSKNHDLVVSCNKRTTT